MLNFLFVFIFLEDRKNGNLFSTFVFKPTEIGGYALIADKDDLYIMEVGTTEKRYSVL